MEVKAFRRACACMSNTWENFDLKRLFDHIRNYTIAGAVGLSAFIYVGVVEEINLFAKFVVGIFLILTFLNALDGSVAVYLKAVKLLKFKDRTANVFFSFVLAMIYSIVAVAVCGTLFLVGIVDYFPEEFGKSGSQNSCAECCDCGAGKDGEVEQNVEPAN